MQEDNFVVYLAYILCINLHIDESLGRDKNFNLITLYFSRDGDAINISSTIPLSLYSKYSTRRSCMIPGGDDDEEEEEEEEEEEDKTYGKEREDMS